MHVLEIFDFDFVVRCDNVYVCVQERVCSEILPPNTHTERSRGQAVYRYSSGLPVFATCTSTFCLVFEMDIHVGVQREIENIFFSDELLKRNEGMLTYQRH